MIFRRKSRAARDVSAAAPFHRAHRPRGLTECEIPTRTARSDVARAILHGCLQDQVDEFHDRHRVGERLGGLCVVAGLADFARDVLRAKLLEIAEKFSDSPWP